MSRVDEVRERIGQDEYEAKLKVEAARQQGEYVHVRRGDQRDERKQQRFCNMLAGLGPGRLCVFPGPSGGGKTTMVSQLVVSYILESKFLGFPTSKMNEGEENKVLLISYDGQEDTFEDTIRMLCDPSNNSIYSMSTEDFKERVASKYYIAEKGKELTKIPSAARKEVALEHLRTTIGANRDYNLIVLDTMSFWLGSMDLNGCEGGDALISLRDLAEELGVCFILLSHAPKHNAKDIMGSVQLRGAVDHVLTVGNVANDRSEKDYSTSYLSKSAIAESKGRKKTIASQTKPIADYYLKVTKSRSGNSRVYKGLNDGDIVFYDMLTTTATDGQKPALASDWEDDSEERCKIGISIVPRALIRKANNNYKMLEDFVRPEVGFPKNILSDICSAEPEKEGEEKVFGEAAIKETIIALLEAGESTSGRAIKKAMQEAGYKFDNGHQLLTKKSLDRFLAEIAAEGVDKL